MKKSLAFRLAQFAILRDDDLGNAEKLEVLRVLFANEDLAHFTESEEEMNAE